MILALTDAVVVVGVVAFMGLLGYLMDRQADGDEHKEITRIPDSDPRQHRAAPTSSGS